MRRAPRCWSSRSSRAPGRRTTMPRARAEPPPRQPRQGSACPHRGCATRRPGRTRPCSRTPAPTRAGYARLTRTWPRLWTSAPRRRPPPGSARTSTRTGWPISAMARPDRGAAQLVMSGRSGERSRQPPVVVREPDGRVRRRTRRRPLSASVRWATCPSRSGSHGSRTSAYPLTPPFCVDRIEPCEQGSADSIHSLSTDASGFFTFGESSRAKARGRVSFHLPMVSTANNGKAQAEAKSGGAFSPSPVRSRSRAGW